MATQVSTKFTAGRDALVERIAYLEDSAKGYYREAEECEQQREKARTRYQELMNEAAALAIARDKLTELDETEGV